MIPQNFALDRTIDFRTAKFKWDLITQEQASDQANGMKGRLAGFLIQFYKTSGNINTQTELKTHKVEGNVTETVITNLPPYSAVRLQIAALNDRYQGEFSAPVNQV